MRKVNPKVFLKAAELIFKEMNKLNGSKYACCPAISDIRFDMYYGTETTSYYGYNSPEHKFFAKLFKPKGVWEGDTWFGGNEEFVSDKTQCHRVTALLMAYEIAKSDLEDE